LFITLVLLPCVFPPNWPATNLKLIKSISKADAIAARHGANSNGKTNIGPIAHRYRFIIFDDHKLIAESRNYPASNDDIAVRLADGWRDFRGGQLWRGASLLRHWRRGTSARSALDR